MAERAADALNAGPLLHRHRVLGVSADVYAANVADSNAVLVVTSGVCTRLCDGPAAFNGAVELDHIMVSDVRPVARWRHMPRADRGGVDVVAFSRRAAVQYDPVYVPHFALR